VRVVHGDAQLGVMNTQEAIRLAKQRGMDLVEVSSNARPPVCKIVDYGKYKYDQKKLKKDVPKKLSRLKEVKFRVGIDPHDYKMKVTRAEGFLVHQGKVRIQLMFRGRQMAHKEIGFELMQEIKEDLSGVAHIDMEPKLAGRHITMMLSPLPQHLQKPKFKVHEEPPEDADDDEEDDDDDEEEIEVRSKPNEDHHHLEVEEEIEHLESDDGRPKLKRGN
jgi:translation initiation factor IF-3